MKSFKTFSLCLALSLVGFVHAASAQTNQQPNATDDSKASCCSASCCAGGVCHMGQHHAHQHAAAQASHDEHAMKDCGDCCSHCADSCKSGDTCKTGDCCKAGSDGAQSCTSCKMGAHHKHAASNHAGADANKADCCAGCTCCAKKDAAR
ncbi:MAG: hypothetical protein QOE33_1998 [Acidobacteriota bacterium]|nr:hypothetical protein [Acidobacteriota bacterium]